MQLRRGATKGPGAALTSVLICIDSAVGVRDAPGMLSTPALGWHRSYCCGSRCYSVIPLHWEGRLEELDLLTVGSSAEQSQHAGASSPRSAPARNEPVWTVSSLAWR